MKTKVLYVDDELFNLQLFALHFKDCYEVLTSESGEQGLQVLEEQNNIELVISDMKMPGMNGIEFISEAKQYYPQISYLILTGFDITNEIKEALNSRLIYRYFCKPLDVDDMSETMKKLIGC